MGSSAERPTFLRGQSLFGTYQGSGSTFAEVQVFLQQQNIIRELKWKSLLKYPAKTAPQTIWPHDIKSHNAQIAMHLLIMKNKTTSYSAEIYMPAWLHANQKHRYMCSPDKIQRLQLLSPKTRFHTKSNKKKAVGFSCWKCRLLHYLRKASAQTQSFCYSSLWSDNFWMCLTVCYQLHLNLSVSVGGEYDWASQLCVIVFVCVCASACDTQVCLCVW